MSATTAMSAGKLRPISEASRLTWMWQAPSAGEKSGVQLVSMLSKRQPRLSSTSASLRIRCDIGVLWVPSPPAENGWSSAIMPRPDRLVSTGADSFTASAATSAKAPGCDSAAARNQDRPLGGGEPCCDLSHKRGIGARRRRLHGGAVVGFVDQLTEDVGGHVDIDRARAAAARQRESGAQHFGQQVGAIDPGRLFGDRGVDALGRNLMGVAPQGNGG